jgi:hypothetical protein
LPDALIDALTAIQTGLQQIPPAVVVVGLLFGPTAAWIGYRFYRTPKSTAAGLEGPDLFWICPECRSANKVRERHCYACGLDRVPETEPLHVVDGGDVLELQPADPVGPSVATPVMPAVVDEPPAAPVPLVAVGPGRRTSVPAEPTAMPEPEAPSWTCVECRLTNDADDDHCRVCGADRVAARSPLRVIGGTDVVKRDPDPSPDVPPSGGRAKKTRRPRAVASTTTKRRSPRRDAAS